MFGKGNNSKSDPRPSDKASFLSNINTLTNYLISHNYPHLLSSKSLQGPSGKEFQQIMEFLIQHFDPSFSIVKPEEDIPYILKALRYPFQISPKSLLSVGSPHTWPPVLAALVWIVDLLTYEYTLQDSDNVSVIAIPFDVYRPLNSKWIKMEILECPTPFFLI
jgi:kinetochore protein NDC80